jgi:hypothetical protein
MTTASTIIVQSSDAAAAWAAAVGAIGGAGLAGLITYRVTRRQVAAENDRFYAGQEAARRAATADRLRDIYATIALAAATLRGVISERSYVREGETKEQRDDRHDRMITEALNTVSTVGGQLLVEDSATEVRETYETLVVVVRLYFSDEATLPSGNDRANRLRAHVDSIVALSDKLLSLSRDHLAALEQPVRAQDGATTITIVKKADMTSDAPTRRRWWRRGEERPPR